MFEQIKFFFTSGLFEAIVYAVIASFYATMMLDVERYNENNPESQVTESTSRMIFSLFVIMCILSAGCLLQWGIRWN